jgi:hypothetical protein
MSDIYDNDSGKRVEEAQKSKIEDFKCTHKNHSESDNDNDCDGNPIYFHSYLLKSDFKDDSPGAHVDLVCKEFIRLHKFDWDWPERTNNHTISLYGVLHGTTNSKKLVNLLERNKIGVLNEIKNNLGKLENLRFYEKYEFDSIPITSEFKLTNELREDLFNQIETGYEGLIKNLKD